MDVSQSKVKLWRRCRRAYEYRYRLRLIRRRVSRPLTFGRLVHTMLESFAKGQDPFAALDKAAKLDRVYFRAEKEMYDEIIRDATTIMEAYLEQPWPKDKRLKYGKDVEVKLEYQFSPELTVTGRLDAIATTPDKRRWLVEHKTCKQIPNDDERWRSVQSHLYIWLIMQCGLPPVEGVCWNYIRSKPPTRPQILKNGTLSTRSVDTLPATVLEVMRTAKLKPTDYPDLMLTAERNRHNYFQRIFAPASSSVLKQVLNDFLRTAGNIAATHATVDAPRTIDRHCSWCDYEPLCRASLTGGDVKFIKKREYTVEKETSDDNAEEE